DELRQRADGVASAAHRVAFEPVTEGEEKQQQRTLEPLAQDGRADRGEQHEEVDLELARTERDDDLLDREPGSEDVGEHEDACRDDGGEARLLEAPAK